MGAPHLLIDTHCHLDAPEFAHDVARVRARADAAGVRLCVLPAVTADGFGAVRALAHAHGDAYALGIHPMEVRQARTEDLLALDAQLKAHSGDPRLVAVGEIGLDGFAPGLDPARQLHFFEAQLSLARRHDLPVLLHLRRSVDTVLACLRRQARGRAWQGIAHAFNGSAQQAQALLGLGLRLGFGGASTYERAARLRRLAATLPLTAIVLETDAPDMPPHWLYRTQAERARGLPQGRNEPAELPRIAAHLAALRGLALMEFARATTDNALLALPRLQAVLDRPPAALLGV
ncbi:MAG: TatD family hydrolase [Burkholderiaceae bacterium]|jgi:TatD DNase family protein|nr:TatD family hydrolase [Burkholderiaceae bacterium]